jgi:hypothetical protein
MSGKIILSETDLLQVYNELFVEEEIYLKLSDIEELILHQVKDKNSITIKIEKKDFLEIVKSFK